MSANRSVQAAQRRRAGPPEPQMPGRGPQPSINSSQMFSGQGQGRSTIQNAPLQRSVPQSSSVQKGDGINSINKMTVTQAIMLITLRLGAIEKKMISENMSNSNSGISLEGQENMVLIDRAVIESITNRLESLERRSSTTSGSTASGPEMSLLKQQMETFRQSIVQTKGTVSKENKELKTQMDTLKQELTETKELLSALQNLTMDNSQKILAFSLEGDNMDGMMELPDADFDGTEELHGVNEFSTNEFSGNEFMGTDLKTLIENEMNSK
jgi:hypothetical protein